MKKIFIAIIAILMLIPNVVFADTQATDLLDTIEAVGLEPSVPDYTETDDQVMIYLFRGSTCQHCHDLVEFLDSITEEYGHMFKLRAYEVGSNSDNYELQQKIADFFDIEAPGVPLLVIGENTFYGFPDSSKEKIKTAIENEYEAEEKYDVFEKMKEKEANKNENDALYILVPILGVAVVAFIFKLAKNEK